MTKLFDILGTESEENTGAPVELTTESIISADATMDELASCASDVILYSDGIAMATEALDDFEDKRVMLDKLAAAPESITPAVTVLALESITSTAAKLGTGFKLKDVEGLSGVAINDAPISGIEVGQESIKDTAKKILEQIKALWAKLVNGAKKLVLKAVVAFNDVAGKAEALKTQINKLKDEQTKKKFDEKEAKKIANKLGVIAIDSGAITAKGVEGLNSALSGMDASGLATGLNGALSGLYNTVIFKGVKSADDIITKLNVVKTVATTHLKKQTGGVLSKIYTIVDKNSNGPRLITRFDGSSVSGIEISIEEDLVKKKASDVIDDDKKVAGLAAKAFNIGSFSEKLKSSDVEKAKVDVWSLADIKTAVGSAASVADEVKSTMKDNLKAVHVKQVLLLTH